MTQEFRVASLAAVSAGEPTLVTVNGTELAVFVAEGNVVVTQGQCPHAEGPLHEGEVDGCVLTCPWHGWTFNLATGRCQEDDSMHLQTYRARIEGDDILVTV